MKKFYAIVAMVGVLCVSNLIAGEHYIETATPAVVGERTYYVFVKEGLELQYKERDGQVVAINVVNEKGEVLL